MCPKVDSEVYITRHASQPCAISTIVIIRHQQLQGPPATTELWSTWSELWSTYALQGWQVLLACWQFPCQVPGSMYAGVCSMLYGLQIVSLTRLVSVQMQACGQPPPEIVDELAPGLAFGEDGPLGAGGEAGNGPQVPGCPMQ